MSTGAYFRQKTGEEGKKSDARGVQGVRLRGALRWPQSGLAGLSAKRRRSAGVRTSTRQAEKLAECRNDQNTARRFNLQRAFSLDAN